MRLLEGEGVTKLFGGLTAVLDVDFHINQSEIVGLIGPNGAGKTTLFNVISGAHPLTSGKTKFNGKDISALKPNQICKLGLARTFQLVKLFGNMTILENVTLASLFGKKERVSDTEAERSALELLEFVGLGDVKGTPARELTLANQKRLEVARALATKPALLLLDELMAGLNPTEVEKSIKLIEKIRDKGITIFMIEHVMKAIMNVCERIMVLHHGEKIAEGTPQEIATSEKIIKVYLGDKAHAGS